MTEPSHPAPEVDQRAAAEPDLCHRCPHAWHGMRCFCGCRTSWTAP